MNKTVAGRSEMFEKAESQGGVTPNGTDPLHDTENEAEENVLEDLMNALLVEGIWDEDNRGEVLALSQWSGECAVHRPDAPVSGPDPDAGRQERMGERRHIRLPADGQLFRWWVDRKQGHYLLFPVYPAVIQRYRYVRGGGVYEFKGERPDGAFGSAVRLGPVETMRRVADTLYGDGKPERERTGGETADRFIRSLSLATEQTRWSLELAKSGSASHREQAEPLTQPTTPPNWPLLELERRASLRDRPFHPVAKAKGGWTRSDYLAYSAEAGQPIRLRWVAVRRDCLLYGGGIGGAGSEYAVCPADVLLSGSERDIVRDAMARCGLPPEQYAALPVHPWQYDAVLPNMLRVELASGVCVPLEAQCGDYFATSSARSLAPAQGGDCHVKLPLGIVSLGAVRYLPAVHMMNGERGQRLLEQTRERDPVLAQRLWLCDETNWWAYLPPDGDLFAEPPRHLSALVRRYPSALTSGGGSDLLPMSALAVKGTGEAGHPFDAVMRLRGMERSAPSAVRLFQDMCVQFFHICLRLFRLGVMPEIHGQNVILILRQGEFIGMLLRDHDSVRLHLPWMERHGLADPAYRMKPGYPNSLYNETPQKLLFYLQTLGIQVNVYSIMDSIAAWYGIEETELWHVLRESLEQAAAMAELSSSVKSIVDESMCGASGWPWKNIVRPLLEQEGQPTGSMPSGAGETVNPFHRLG